MSLCPHDNIPSHCATCREANSRDDKHCERCVELEGRVAKLEHSLSCTKGRFLGDHQNLQWWYPARPDLYMAVAEMRRRADEFEWKDAYRGMGAPFDAGYLWPFYDGKAMLYGAGDNLEPILHLGVLRALEKADVPIEAREVAEGEFWASVESLIPQMKAALCAQSATASAWQPIATAPKDGTLVLLLIGPEEAREHPLEDTAEVSRTIGHNNLENDGEDKWEFAGWCWSHDHYTQGGGTPTGWMPLPAVPCEQNDIGGQQR